MLRTARRRAAWDDLVSCSEEEFQELLEVEFSRDGKLDLQLSVYEISSQSPYPTRAYTEHAANAGIDPPKGAVNIDVEGVFGPSKKATPGGEWFQFTYQAHRELVFISEIT